MPEINMKKRKIFCFVLIVVLLGSFVIAQSDNDISEEKKIDNAYSCLNNEIKTAEKILLQDAIFGVLAVGSNEILLKKIDEEKKSDEDCWPKADCKIKETAQVLLAYDRIGKDTGKIKDWLISKSANMSNIAWYLEIDTQGVPSECNIKYSEAEHKINLNEDGKISGNLGNCLKVAREEYWLEINSQCIDKEFEISCNNSNFLSALVYQKRGGNIIFVISKEQSASLGASVIEKIDAKCLSTGSSCDYEGTLWAAIALEEIKEDNEDYMPYLLAMSEDNSKFLPEAFLYTLGQQDLYFKIIEKQKMGKYWEIAGSSYGKFYDTSVALLAIEGDNNNVEEQNAKNYLLSVQTKEGCWGDNNIRDTAFILYSAWQRSISGASEKVDCIEANYFCEFSNKCLESQGKVFDDLACSGIKKCCSVKVKELSCFEKQGIICSTEQKCTGNTEISSDGSCCVEGECVDKTKDCTGEGCADKTKENPCDAYDGICRTSCSDEEEEKEEVDCLSNDEICCAEKVKDPTPDSEPDSEGSKIRIYILIFGILILLIIIAIVYRRKRGGRVQEGKERGGAENVAMGPRGPGEYPMMAPQERYAPSQRGVISNSVRRTSVGRSQADKEMDEMMRNLKNK